MLAGSKTNGPNSNKADIKHSKKGDRMAKFSTSGQDFDDYDQEYYEECKEDGLGVID